MDTHNICLYKLDKKDTGCNLRTIELLDYELIGVCAVIRSNIYKYDVFINMIWAVSSEKVFLNLHKTYHQGLCSSLIHSVVSTDSVGG